MTAPLRCASLLATRFPLEPAQLVDQTPSLVALTDANASYAGVVVVVVLVVEVVVDGVELVLEAIDVEAG